MTTYTPATLRAMQEAVTALSKLTQELRDVGDAECANAAAMEWFGWLRMLKAARGRDAVLDVVTDKVLQEVNRG